MGALEMGLNEDELPPLVDAWRQSNPNIVKLWWDVDRAALEAVRNKHTNSTHGIVFSCQSGMLFITLPSGRRLAYVKPRIGENKFGGQCITYEGVGGTKKWERLDSYGPKFVENIVQATSRDILCYAMRRFGTAPLSCISTMNWSLRLIRVCLCRRSANRWAGRRLGRRACCCGRMATRQISIKKTNGFSAKTGFRLHWVTEVD
jgi:hypothetical protein